MCEASQGTPAGPVKTEVKEGKTYYWCTCGKSQKQPWCDGSHQGTAFLPLPYKADSTGEKIFCTCKHTDNPPLCDGSHS